MVAGFVGAHYFRVAQFTHTIVINSHITSSRQELADSGQGFFFVHLGYIRYTDTTKAGELIAFAPVV